MTSPFDVRLFGFATKFEENPNVVQPDVLVICDQEKINGDGRYEGVPSLLVEVLSPSTKRKDMVLKLKLYMESGVREYWMVDPEKTSTAFPLKESKESMEFCEEGDTVKSTFFEGLEIPLGEIFPEVR